MNKVEEKHREIANDGYRSIGTSNPLSDDVLAISHASITQDVAIKFADWKEKNAMKNIAYRYNIVGKPDMTIEELYNEFITNHYKP